MFAQIYLVRTEIFIIMKKYAFIIILFLNSLPVYSSVIDIDSLKTEIESASGKEKVDLIVELAAKLNIKDTWAVFGLAEDAVVLAKRLDYKRGLAGIYSELGMAYSITGDYKQALEYYKESEKLFRTSGNDLEIARACYRLGITHSDRGSAEQGLQYLHGALRIIESREYNARNYQLLKTKIYQGIGSVYKRLGERKKGVFYLNKSLQTSLMIKDKINCPECFLVEGGIYKELGEYEKALVKLKEALTSARSIGAQTYIGQSYLDAGESFAALGDYKSAVEYYYLGLDILREMDNKKKIIQTHLNIGAAFFEDEMDFDKAITHFEKAYQLAQRFDFLFMQLQALTKLFNAYEKNGGLAQAIAYQKEISSLKDSVLSRDKAKQIEDLRIKYETEKTEAENEMLKKRNQLQSYLLYLSIVVVILILLLIIVLYLRYRNKKKTNEILNLKNRVIEEANIELKERNEQITDQKEELSALNEDLQRREKDLSEANAAKDKFFSIIAHDLKNPLNVLTNYTEMLRDSYDYFDNDTRKKYINDLASSVSHMLKLIQNLLEWSRAHKGRIDINRQTFDLYEAVFNNIYLLKNQAKEKNISLDSRVPQNMLVYADFNMISTVIRNLLSNAVKFTPAGGRVDVNAEESGEFFEVSIKDSGVGISESRIDKLFRIDENTTTRGTAQEEGTGLGLILCKEFIEQNGGGIRVESREGEGSRFIFTIPKGRQ